MAHVTHAPSFRVTTSTFFAQLCRGLALKQFAGIQNVLGIKDFFDLLLEID